MRPKPPEDQVRTGFVRDVRVCFDIVMSRYQTETGTLCECCVFAIALRERKVG